MTATFERHDNSKLQATRCINPPQFDIFRSPPRFVFSTCWVRAQSVALQVTPLGGFLIACIVDVLRW